MLVLDYHYTSRYFAKQFRLTHFLPMYYTAYEGGISGQFWARATDHLPIDYRPGKRLHAPPDWEAWSFQPEHLREFSYVLVGAATPDDPAARRSGFRRAQRILDDHAVRLTCEGLVCLYSVPPASRERLMPSSQFEGASGSELE
jgi:hypothetical protein